MASEVTNAQLELIHRSRASSSTSTTGMNAAVSTRTRPYGTVGRASPLATPTAASTIIVYQDHVSTEYGTNSASAPARHLSTINHIARLKTGASNTSRDPLLTSSAAGVRPSRSVP